MLAKLIKVVCNSFFIKNTLPTWKKNNLCYRGSGTNVDHKYMSNHPSVWLVYFTNIVHDFGPKWSVKVYIPMSKCQGSDTGRPIERVKQVDFEFHKYGSGVLSSWVTRVVSRVGVKNTSPWRLLINILNFLFFIKNEHFSFIKLLVHL